MDTTLHYTSVSHADSLMSAINKMRLNSDLCDVAVVIGNFRIMAHRIILSASAPYFYQLFQPCNLQASLKEYHLDDIDETAALKIIEFCYTSAISLDDEIVWPLLSAADKLDCAEISQLCFDYLSSALDATTCLSMHKKSLQFNCFKMSDKTSQFIADHAEQLCASPTLHCLAPQELVTLLTSLRDLSWEDDKLLPIAVAWLDVNGGRGQVVRQLMQEFPDLSNKLQQFLQADGTVEVTMVDNSHVTENFGQVQAYSHTLTPGPLVSELSGVMEAPLHVCVSCGDAFDTAGGLSCHMEVCEELVQLQTSKGRRGVSDSPQLQTIKGRRGVSDSPQLQTSRERGRVSESPDHEGADSVESCGTKDSTSAPGSCPSDTLEREKTVLGDGGDKLDDSHLVNTPGLANPGNPLRLTNPSIVPGSAYPGDLCNKSNSLTNGGMEVPTAGGDVTVFPFDSDKDACNSQGVNDTNNNDINDIPSTDDDCQDNSDEANIEIDVVNDDGESDSQFPHRMSPHRMSPHRMSPLSPSPMKQNYISYMTPTEETFTCKICKQEFCKRKSLAKHWRVVHGLHQDNQGGGEDCTGKEGGDDMGETKKLKTEEACQLEGSCDPQSKMEALDPQFLMEQYLKQYSQFTRWYVEQGLMFCQFCLVYHTKGSTCPQADAAPDGQVKQMLSRREDDQTNCKDDEGPLDMSKTSATFSSPQSSHSGAQPGANNSSAYVSSPLDISSYYSYAHMLATAASSDNVDRNQYNLFYPDTQSVLRSMDFAGESIYNPYHRNSLSSTYPLSLVSEARTDSPSVSRYSATPQDSVPNLYMAAPAGPQKRKLTSRQGFPCTVCGRVFSYQAALFTHMRTHSPSSRTYECQLCHQVFAQAPDLKVHACPNGVEKPYNCSSCGQTFAKNIHLKRHLATHSGLKPYPCWVCGKRFSRSDHLKRHTQSIHAGSRPHGCHLCEKEFVRKYELNKHMLTHSVEKLGAESSQNSGAGNTQDLPGWNTEPVVKS